MKFFLAIVAAIALATPAFAGTKHDVFGHVYQVDDNTAITPGAGSAMGAVIGSAIDSSALYVAHDWDLTLSMLATGSDEPGQEYALGAITAWKFVGKEMKVGLDFSRDVERPVYGVTPKFKFYVFTDPVDNWSKGIVLSLGSYKFAAGNDAAFEGGGLSLEPAIMATAEWPVKDFGTIEVQAGIKDTMTQPDVNPPDTAQAILGFGLNLWLARPDSGQ